MISQPDGDDSLDDIEPFLDGLRLHPERRKMAPLITNNPTILLQKRLEHHL